MMMALPTTLQPVENFKPQQILDALSAGLCWRDGEPNLEEKSGFEDFAARIGKYYPLFVREWSGVGESHDISAASKAFEYFLVRISSADTLDAEMPLVRAQGKAKNSFTFVRLLKSFSTLLAGHDDAVDFLEQLGAANPRPSVYLFHTALAQLLHERGRVQEAAAAALLARGLRGFDLCVSKTVYATQEALAKKGMPLGIDYDFKRNEEYFCDMPFRYFNLTSRAGADELTFGLCKCRGWLPVQFDFNQANPWNSDDAQELRSSVLDGNFKYCDKLECPHLRYGRLPQKSDIEDPYLKEIIDSNRTELDKGPRTLVLAYDLSCNLSCPSCRDSIVMADKETVASFDNILPTILDELLPNVEILHMNQVGEALASAHYRKLLRSISRQKYPDLKITLMSNLKLLSAQTWETLQPGMECINVLSLSIDGATPQTLEKLRRGLTWDRFVEALTFVKELKTSAAISGAGVTFVVQKDNFRELSQMLKICSDYSLDHLVVAPIIGHGSYSNEEFMELNVANPSHDLNSEYITAKEDVLFLFKQMQENKPELLTQGKSAPRLIMNA